MKQVIAENNQLIWFDYEANNKSFTRITMTFLGLTIVFAMVVKLTQLPEITRAKKEKIPVQLTQFIDRIKIVPKPKPKPKPKAEVKKQTTVPKIKQKPDVAKKSKKMKPAVKVKEKALEKAKDKAKRSGLLALADDLALMRDSLDFAPLVQAKKLNKIEPKAIKTERVMLAKKMPLKSTGLDQGQLSQTRLASTALAQRNLVALAAEVSDDVEAQYDELDQDRSNAKEQRKIDSIRQVLDKNKGAIYTLYRRALRKDPSLEGKVTIELVIEENGSVSMCQILLSELNNPEIERKLISRIKLINFGANLGSQTRLNYSFNFLPF
ncbi:AgmX/PglI C-terminal domain-containing protein [Pseudoalteromonas denitrificans]|uniref:Outer membrane transport energization protein TonB n=1 Tax=Pseudoalteromonas denitrificans DSM 6059 TaxID=1123010 RepID=A0A1I1SNK2_9GAMM|nr:AgmX/PglI C-terminal domain-containing protein [Pseudoalteromonas denitrificans]SFD48027.1 hypothetical protein SAMN02745724_04642 [Pseudoalteromonas denitrificans DSM 6059]